jgi:uncharacterized surface protein with fasciclin (FAS1) repeats
MSTTRLFIAAAAAALITSGAAAAQTPAPSTAPAPEAPAAAPAPAASAATPAPAASTDAAAKPVTAQGDLVDTLKLSGQFTTFVGGLDATNLTGLLKTNKNLTVFAPTDAAFAQMPADQLAKLKSDKQAMQKLLLHHIINAPVDSSKIKGAKGPVPSGAGDQILLDGSDEAGALKVDGATITQADIHTGSGLLHVVDHVLVSGQGATASAAATAESAESAAKPSAFTGTNGTTEP